ncbi:MAG: SDR family NAD(P)-dependent oxidoreductase [Endozoicomonas sp.]
MKNNGLVWITGASQGIGRALAIELARRGKTVAASARNKEKLSALVQDAEQLPGKIFTFSVDVTDQAAVELTVDDIEKQLGGIDQAVLNAGTFLPMEGSEFRADVVRDHFELNVMGVCYCIEPLVQRMSERGKGLIAINGSLAGYRGLPKSSAYGASKAALINLAESLYLDLRKPGIDVKIINPGFVRTPLTDRNAFPMPFLTEAEKAASIIADGLSRKAFEIHFPVLFSSLMGFLRLLPNRFYLALAGKL